MASSFILTSPTSRQIATKARAIHPIASGTLSKSLSTTSRSAMKLTPVIPRPGTRGNERKTTFLHRRVPSDSRATTTAKVLTQPASIWVWAGATHTHERLTKCPIMSPQSGLHRDRQLTQYLQDRVGRSDRRLRPCAICIGMDKFLSAIKYQDDYASERYYRAFRA